MSQFKVVPLDLLDHNPPELLARPLPKESDKDWAKVLEFCDSIEKVGLLNSFSVREADGKFYVTDGNHRLMAIKKNFAEGRPNTVAAFSAGVPVNVVEMNDIESLAAQVCGNHHSFQQKPASKATALYKMIVHGGYDMKTMESKTGMSQATIDTYLKLVTLPTDVKSIVDTGSISLSNAVQLTKLPVGTLESPEAAKSWVEAAITKTNAELAVDVANAVKAAKAANQTGEKRAAEFVPEARLRSKEEISQKLAQAQYSFEESATEENRVVLETLKWIFQLDDTSVSEAKAKYDTKKAEADKAKADREFKRNEDKLNEAKKLISEKTGIDIESLLK